MIGVDKIETLTLESCIDKRKISSNNSICQYNRYENGSMIKYFIDSTKPEDSQANCTV